jgi:hypothetical protein
VGMTKSEVIDVMGSSDSTAAQGGVSAIKVSIKTSLSNTSKKQVVIWSYTPRINERYRMLCSASLNTSKFSI